jgi:hypothetical protein
MTFKPISYSPEMIKAIQLGRKTKTRRLRGLKYPSMGNEYSSATIDHDVEVVNDDGDVVQLKGVCFNFDDGEYVVQSYYQPGDILWVRESFYEPTANVFKGKYFYKAGLDEMGWSFKWKPSIHMPKIACRIWQRVISVNIERLSEISEEDAVAEGIRPLDIRSHNGMQAYENYLRGSAHYCTDPVVSFATLWQSIHGKPVPVHRNKDGRKEISHYEVFPFDVSESWRFEDFKGDFVKHKGKHLIVCPNPWVAVIEVENIFERPEGFLS